MSDSHAETDSDSDTNLGAALQKAYEANEDSIKTLIDFAENHETCFLWEFQQAPDILRCIFSQGGDEDYLSFTPNSYGGAPYLFESNSFGCCDRLSFSTQFGDFHVGTHA